MNLSYWEKQTFFPPQDIWIIGSGIVGLSAAISLKEKDEKLKVSVAERGILPSGASTRNAGFACFGSLTELMDDISKHPEEQVMALVKKRWLGLQNLRRILGDEQIGYRPYGGFEVFQEKDTGIFESCMEKMGEMNNLLEDVLGEKEIFSQVDNLLPDLPFKKVRHMIRNRCEGQLDTGKMMRALIDYARELGVQIFNGIEVKRIESQGTAGHELITKDGWKLPAKKVLVTTNGFIRQMLPDLPVTPARNQVLITKPIPGLSLRGSFHYDRGYVYFRNVGNRILLGGARNIDLKGEETDTFGFSTPILEKLTELMNEMILPGISWEPDLQWSGIMGIGEEKAPILREIEPGIWVAVRLGGMGVAIGTLVGRDIASQILKP